MSSERESLHSSRTWEERIRLAVGSWAHWYQLPDAARMDRVMKEAGFRDLVVANQNLISAIEQRADAGHNDTCQSQLETDESYPCNCGHSAILTARSLALVGGTCG